MNTSHLWTLVVLTPAIAWAESPRNVEEFENAVREFCDDREALTKAAVAASKTEQRFQLVSAAEAHRGKQRDLADRADELRTAANRGVLRSLVRMEAMRQDSTDARARLAQWSAQLERCAAIDDGFVAWATKRTQELTNEELHNQTQQNSDDAYARHIARGVGDASSLEDRVVSISPPSVEQTVALYIEVNPERFVFASRQLEDIAGRHRRLVAGEAVLLTRAPGNGRVQVLTIEGLQFEVDVRGISLTPLKGKKSAPIEPGWLKVADQPTAYLRLAPAIARVTGLFPQQR